MAGLQIKSVKSPDEVRPFIKHGHTDLINLDSGVAMHAVFEPGWKWKEDVGPMAGTATCQAPHLLYCLSGRMRVIMDDGSEGEYGAGDTVSIAPGHDAWVVGDEACEVIDFGGFADYAK